MTAILARVLLTPLWGNTQPYFTFHAAVIAAAWLGGLAPGLVVTFLCAAVAVSYWIPPIHSFRIDAGGDLVSTGVFLFIGVTVSFLSEALQRRERQIDRLLESISDGFMVLDREWRCTFVNERAARLMHRTRQEMLGRRIWNELPDLAGSAFDVEARQAFTERIPHQIEFFYEPHGLWLETRMYPSRAGLAVYLQDITERRRAEDASFHLTAIVQSSDDAIVSKDLNGTIRSWNPAAERLFGFTQEEAVGRSITIMIPPERLHEERHVLDRIRNGLTVDHFETVRMRKDGSRIDISLTVSPVRTAAGKIIGASKIARDISDRRQAEKERQELWAREQAARVEAEAASRAKDEFLVLLSHELRTPLNAVYGWASMLRAGQLDEATRARALEAIIRNSNAQVQLIDDLLDISRIVSGKMHLDVQTVDLPAVIADALDVVGPTAAAKDIRLQSVIDPRIGPTIGDPNRLRQVVWNLLSNAVKFTPKGGQVQVHLQRVDAHIELVVSDTGEGISSELLPVVFERFRQGESSTTREHGGLGLGLALVKYLVELHGGRVEAHSPGKGKGTTLTVTIPLATPHAPSVRGGAQRPTTGQDLATLDSKRLDGLRVLVVDDDADALDLVTAILGRAGAVVKACRSAAAALETMPHWIPDAIISDIEMPGEDGYALIRKVRALDLSRGGEVAAIALTAYGRAEDRFRALSAGFNMHVPKPVDPLELTTLVASLAGR
jgi:PAS domain S-box-containing protein